MKRIRLWLAGLLIGREPFIANVRISGIIETPDENVPAHLGPGAIVANFAMEDAGLRGDVHFDCANTTTIDLASGGGVK